MHLILIWGKTPCAFYDDFVYKDIYVKWSLLFCSGTLLINPCEQVVHILLNF